MEKLSNDVIMPNSRIMVRGRFFSDTLGVFKSQVKLPETLIQGLPT
jgi:hypothetical protein